MMDLNLIGLHMACMRILAPDDQVSRHRQRRARGKQNITPTRRRENGRFLRDFALKSPQVCYVSDR